MAVNTICAGLRLRLSPPLLPRPFAPYLITPSSRACLHKRMQERPISHLDEYGIAGVFTFREVEFFPFHRAMEKMKSSSAIDSKLERFAHTNIRPTRKKRENPGNEIFSGFSRRPPSPPSLSEKCPTDGVAATGRKQRKYLHESSRESQEPPRLACRLFIPFKRFHMRAFTGYEERERERNVESGEKDGKRRGGTQRRWNRAMDPAGKGF